MTSLLQVTLAILFGIAGLAKALDGKGTRAMLEDFGISKRTAPVLAVLLCGAEIAVAVGLLTQFTVTLAAGAASVLQLVFSAAIVVSLRRERRPDCRCFGSLLASPVNWTTLLRSVLIAVCAGYIYWAATHGELSSISAGLDSLESALLLNWPVAGLMAVVLLLMASNVILLRRVGQLLLRLDDLESISPSAAPLPTSGPALQSQVPSFTLQNQAGSFTSLRDLLAPDRCTVLLFGDTSCSGCSMIWGEINDWRATIPASTLVLIIAGGHSFDPPRGVEPEEILIADDQVFATYRLSVIPALIVVDGDGTVIMPPAFGPEAIRSAIVDIERLPPLVL